MAEIRRERERERGELKLTASSTLQLAFILA
jgi:hypothetical protein